jgi:hypothetical protein
MSLRLKRSNADYITAETDEERQARLRASADDLLKKLNVTRHEADMTWARSHENGIRGHEAYRLDLGPSKKPNGLRREAGCAVCSQRTMISFNPNPKRPFLHTLLLGGVVVGSMAFGAVVLYYDCGWSCIKGTSFRCPRARRFRSRVR